MVGRIRLADDGCCVGVDVDESTTECVVDEDEDEQISVTIWVVNP